MLRMLVRAAAMRGQLLPPAPPPRAAGLDQPAVPRPAAPGAAPAAGAQQQQAAAAPPAAPAGQPFDMFGGGAAAAEPADAGPLAALRHNPQFMALRAMVQQRPELLQPMLAVRRGGCLLGAACQRGWGVALWPSPARQTGGPWGRT